MSVSEPSSSALVFNNSPIAFHSLVIHNGLFLLTFSSPSSFSSNNSKMVLLLFTTISRIGTSVNSDHYDKKKKKSIKKHVRNLRNLG
jgi:hypothetical protein